MELNFSVKEKSFGKTARVTKVLSGVSFTVPAQSIVCLYGPSGCGKSTMLRIAAGLDTDYRGHVYLGEDSITHPTRDIGFVVQTAVSYDWLTVADNIAFGLKYAERQRQASSFNRLMGRVDSAYAMAEAKRIASVVGLSLADLAKRPSEISVGMKQRMSFARALLTNPQVLLLDEPFSSLDFESRQSLQDVVLRVRDELGTSFLCVSHDPEEVLYLADEVIVLGGAPAAIVFRMNPILPYHGSEGARYTQEFQQAKKDLQQWLIPTTQQMPRKATDLRSVSLP